MPTLLERLRKFIAENPIQQNERDISNPKLKPQKINWFRDCDEAVQLKLNFNMKLLLAKMAYNGIMSVEAASHQFVLVFDPKTGERPAWAPNSRQAVLDMDIDDWYDLGAEMGMEWEEEEATIGRCRREWCSLHNVSKILTYAEMMAE
ncbi:hypothetical protein BJ508DRAFT_337044 [Ascobolus immersus RN42]|uniref:Uncharacterized protein n=1 Tax=Ascobolus immersus RN42 TaxID=1160509 RepID=A0A3N4H9A1_ASCIM|nr:hypothetical protein BJ508DRAFT_337044 [Ascobolus immersus RN42]